jgi:hypothetical protein
MNYSMVPDVTPASDNFNPAQNEVNTDSQWRYTSPMREMYGAKKLPIDDKSMPGFMSLQVDFTGRDGFD